MELFTSRITEPFSIRQVARELTIDYSLVHRAIKPLETQKILKRGRCGITLSFREHHALLSYVEYLRRDALFDKYKDLAMCLETFIKRFKEESFVLLLFGSIVKNTEPKDVDILLIVDHEKKTESAEAFLHNISRDYDLDHMLHIFSISYESVYEMLRTREQRNVMNETLNKHIIVHGAELYYRLLNKGRK